MKEKGIKIFLAISIFLASILMPFSVYAETVSGAPIIGVNITLIDYDYSTSPYQGEITLTTDQTRWHCESWSSGCRTWVSEGLDDVVDDEITGTISYTQTIAMSYLYEYDFIFDKAYVGWIKFSDGSLGATTAKTYYVNGTHLTLTSISLIDSFTISSYNLTALPENVIQWDFPIESYTFINQFYQYGYENVENFNEGYYVYPLFDVPTSSVIQSNWSNGSTDLNQVLILGVSGNINDYNAFLRYFSVSNISLIKFNLLYRKDRPSGTNQTFSIFSIEYNIQDSSVSNYVTFTTLGNWEIIPIYNEYYPLNKTINISTDFALRYGLRNRLLDNLDIIANGTTASDTAASGLENSNSQMASDMNNLATIENDYNNQFDQQLQNIDFSNPIQTQQGILPAANFVITVFNGLINNNPFYVLIIIVCILFIGKKVIGK